MSRNFLDELNEVQRNAAATINGPLMVIAGAGSGKTRVLTYRIAHLIQQNIDPFNILSLTFTNKAAKEMKERITKIVGSNDAKNIWMGTFHSVFSKILRVEADKLNYPRDFTIYDTDDAKRLMKKIIQELNLDDKTYTPNVVLSRISAAKSHLISWEQYSADNDIQTDDKMGKKPMIGKLYEHYWKRLVKASAMDFDDLLYNTHILLKNFPDVLYKYQSKFRYILVDEYQDTNIAQYSILKLLAARFENLCVVGDDAQSIYAFRGADIQNILNFQKDYPDSKIFKLEQNYRSTQTIVNAANSVIAKNKAQIPKKIWTSNDNGDRIKVVRNLSETEEGHMVARNIFETKMNEQRPNSDFAILYRTNAQSRSLEEALRKQSIPYRIYGGLSFYQRKEIKDTLCYCRLAINPNDEEALARVLNYPMRGIGKTTEEKLILKANELNSNLWYVIQNIKNLNIDLNTGAKNRISDFAIMINSFSIISKSKDAYETASFIANHSGIIKDLLTDETPEGKARYENIEELLNGIKDFVDKEDDVKPEEEALDKSLSSFMQDVALLTNDDKDDPNDKDRVALMTIHAAKGLEFPYVYLVGMEENLFPSQQSLTARTDLEEERRLFYVALTRAEKQIMLSYAQTRYRWGSLTSCEPSRFIEDIDPQYLDAASKPRPTLGSTGFSFGSKPGATSPSGFGTNKNTGSSTGAPTRNSNFSQQNNNQGNRQDSNWQPYQRQKPEPPKPGYAPVPQNLTRMDAAANKPSTAPSNLSDQNLSPGTRVQHERFGAGKILSVEGSGADKKLIVFFENSGQKQLLLRFAKLTVIN